MSISRIFGSRTSADDEHWISVSDLMAGLMVIFLFIAITYIRDIRIERDQIRQIAVAFDETKSRLYEALEEEFRDDLPRWNAELDRQTLSLRFQEPEILFDSQSTNLKDKFRLILADFFPRYLRVLRSFEDSIEEVRVEGHTSSEWQGARDGDDAYFRNMDLSQGRTRAVLEYCLLLPAVLDSKQWAIRYLTANGLSSSKPIIGEGEEDRERSRRVEFRVRTNAETQIVRILGTNRP